MAYLSTNSGSGGGSGITEAQAITAVEGEGTLDLTGDVTIAAGKDFTVDTDTLHVDATNDRVGIGTTSPSTMLHLSDSAATSPSILIENTGTNASEPELKFLRSGTSADSQDIGHIKFQGENDNSESILYASIFSDMSDDADGAEDGRLFFSIMRAGTFTEFMRCDANRITLNAGGANLDFRVQGDTDTDLLYTDATNGRLGISTNTPIASLDVDSGQTFRSTRLLTVSITSTPSNALTEADHAGRYIFVTGSSTVITLPDNQAAGVHFTLLSNDSNGFTLRTGTSGSTGDNMNGSQADITVDARNGVTAISTGTDYVVLGA